MLVLVYMIFRTIKSLNNKDVVEEGRSKDKNFSAYLVLGLVAEIIALIWMIKFYFF